MKSHLFLIQQLTFGQMGLFSIQEPIYCRTNENSGRMAIKINNMELLWMNVKSRRCIVNNDADFIHTVDISLKVSLVLMTNRDILQNSENLLSKNCKMFTNITKIHHLEIHNDETVGYATTRESKPRCLPLSWKQADCRE